MGRRTDGRGLFYPGKSHTVVAETEAGKTWLVMAAAWEEMMLDHHVLCIDWEGDEVTALDRLRAIMPRDRLLLPREKRHPAGYGAELIESHFHYLPEDDLRVKSNASDIGELVHAFRPSLAISDGTTKAMAVHNLDPLDNSDIAIFNKILVRPLLSFGTAVASLDLVLESHGEDSATIKIWPATERDQDAQDERPIEHMPRVAEAITERGSIKSKAQIEKAVEGKTDLIRDAIYWLIVDGYLPRKGPYAMLKPYPSEGEES